MRWFWRNALVPWAPMTYELSYPMELFSLLSRTAEKSFGGSTVDRPLRFGSRKLSLTWLKRMNNSTFGISLGIIATSHQNGPALTGAF